MKISRKKVQVYYLIYFISILFSQSDTTKSTLYDLRAQTIDGEDKSFDIYKGKMILIVNVASKCGYTYQYKSLQTLYQKYNDFIEVLGFPSNDFFWQEPGTNSEIQAFCKLNYGVTFQMFEKINIKGSNMHPIYQWLSDSTLNGWNNKLPEWNFCKYLIDEEGNLIDYYNMKVDPMDTLITNHIEKFKKIQTKEY